MGQKLVLDKAVCNMMRVTGTYNGYSASTVCSVLVINANLGFLSLDIFQPIVKPIIYFFLC